MIEGYIPNQVLAAKNRAKTWKYGYNSKDVITLLWFFNQHKKAVKINVEYYIIYKSKKYNSKELIAIFKNNKKWR